MCRLQKHAKKEDEPWCAMFTWWCAQRAGYWGWADPGFAHCQQWCDWARHNGYLRCDPGYKPVPGDLFIKGPCTGWVCTHTGVVIGTDPGGRIITIEGNTSCPCGGTGIWHKKHPRFGGGYGIACYVHMPEHL